MEGGPCSGPSWVFGDSPHPKPAWEGWSPKSVHTQNKPVGAQHFTGNKPYFPLFSLFPLFSAPICRGLGISSCTCFIPFSAPGFCLAPGGEPHYPTQEAAGVRCISAVTLPASCLLPCSCFLSCPLTTPHLFGLKRKLPLRPLASGQVFL